MSDIQIPPLPGNGIRHRAGAVSDDLCLRRQPPDDAQECHRARCDRCDPVARWQDEVDDEPIEPAAAISNATAKHQRPDYGTLEIFTLAATARSTFGDGDAGRCAHDRQEAP